MNNGPWSDMIAGRFVASERQPPAIMVGGGKVYSPNPIEYRISDQLDKRYGNKDEWKMGNAMLSDMGAGDYNVGFVPDAKSSKNVVGAYAHGPNVMKMSRNESEPISRNSTLFHELYHAAERINGQSGPWSGGDHFGTIKNAPEGAPADEALARMLEAQDDVNKGYDVKGASIKQMPWLRGLSQASNQPIGPWAQLPQRGRMPSNMWNGLYQSQFNEEATPK